jgi:hypothetical protein
MNRNDINTATRAALVIFLKEADAYSGHSRDNLAALREHALATWDAAQPSDMERDEDIDFDAQALEAAVEAKPEPAKRGGDKVAILKAIIDAAEKAEDGSVILTADMLKGTGLPAVCWKYRAPWSIQHNIGAGRAVAELGYRPKTRKDDTQEGGFHVQLTPCADPFAKPARKANTAKVSTSTVTKMATAIGNATAQDNGVIVLTAEDLAMAGVGISWVRTSNDALANPEDVKARTFAVLGFTAQSSRNTLVLTPVAAAEQADEQVA